MLLGSVQFQMLGASTRLQLALVVLLPWVGCVSLASFSFL